MKQRYLKGLICFALLLGMLCSFPFRAKAVTNLAVSEDGIAVLKQLEGFSKYPYADGGQYSVGFGSGCPDEDLQRYRTYGISESEADTLLREYLEKMEAVVNRFCDRNSLHLTQNQFDALILFTYNVGAGWVDENSDFREAVRNSMNGNDFIYYMTRWCASDAEILPGLVNRRLAEADMYLNGNYSSAAPSYYSYVYLDANGGSCISKIQGYDASEPAKVKPAATRDGYQFLGWYTEKNGGRQITDLDLTTKQMTLFAHWQKSGATTGTSANYQRRALKDLTAYAEPRGELESGTVKAGQTVTIVMDYVDSTGALWGKLSTGGWILLKDTEQILEKAEKPNKVNVTVTVTGTFVNVRKGPGVSYALAGKAYYGDRLVISETVMVGTALWGKYSGGWLSLEYTDYASVSENLPDSGSEPETVIATGQVVNCTALRLRSGPGTSYTAIGSLSVGTKVSITQRKTVGTSEWGKIAGGWICLDYVQLDAEVKPEEKPEEKPADPEEKPTQPEQTPTNPETKKQTGVVTNCAILNVRSGPGTHNPKVTTLARGTKVVVTETVFVNNITWGKIQQGWVSMAYIQLDYSSDDLGDGVEGTVYNCTRLNIRRAPGTNSTPVGFLLPGAKVTVYERTEVGGMSWGRIDQGWVCLTYINLGTVGSTPEEEEKPTTPPVQPEETPVAKPENLTGKVIGTNALRIRSGAGTHYPQVGTLTGGTVVTILERTTVKGISWGRIDKGWICLNYVQLDTAGEGFTGTVTANGLRIRSTAGVTGAVIGYYNIGTKVTILETTTVAGVGWGRTNKGWICLQYVKR